MADDVFNLSGISTSIASVDSDFNDYSGLNISRYDLDISSSGEEAPRRQDLVDHVLSHYIRHNITLSCLVDTLKLLAIAQSSNEEIPETKFSILKLIEERSSLSYKRNYYIECSKCAIYSGGSSTKHNNKCNNCGQIIIAKESNFFIYMPVKNQIIDSLKMNWTLLEQFNEKKIDTDSISDVHSGIILRELNNSFSNSEGNIISLTLNTDGANKFKSNSFSVWPIQLIQNYLPPEIRFKPSNILTVGLYYGSKKPNCMQYFFPLVSEIEKLHDTGLSLTFKNQSYTFLPVITHCVVDLPAKRMLQCIKQYNGRNACTYCHHPGVTVQNSKKLKVIRYTYTYKSYPLRNNLETLKSMNKTSFHSFCKDGVMAKSCLASLQSFNIIHGFGIDYMHCALLGVVRKLLDFYMNPKYHKRVFFLKKKKLASLEQKLLSIKPIREIIRKPRPFKDVLNYKANELRSILLYYFPVCLINILPRNYVTNFQQFSFAIYILLKSEITNQDLIDATTHLKSFVRDFEMFFGKSNMVMNVHLLTHIVESVRFLGPLWAQSAFAFERNNGCLLKSVCGTRDVLDQMSGKYLLKKYLQTSRKYENKIKIIGRPKKVKEIALTLIHDSSGKCTKIVNQEFFAYTAIEQNGIKYTSLLHRELKKSIDYVVGLESGCFGIAKYYIYYENIHYVVLEEYEVMEEIGHISEIEPTSLTIYAPVNSITKKFIYMNVNNKQYISNLPNEFENK